MKKLAYCTLIMKGDGYIPGALILGYSLKIFASPGIDIIAMVTSDVSKKGKRLLSTLFKVVEVPYLEYQSNPILLQTPKQKERYRTWLSASYTKWNMLKFHEYDKILFLDADVILVRNIDDIFDFNTPAAVFASPWSESYFDPNPHISKKKGYPDFYKKIKFGDSIPSSNILKAFNNKGHVLIGSSVLLSPKKRDYEEFIKMLNNNEPFGFKVSSGNDEQVIAYFYYLKKKKWTSLPPNLNTVAWKLHMLKLKKDKITSDCFKKGGSKKGKKTIRIKKGGFDIQDKRKTKDLNKCNLIMCMVPHVIHYFGDTKAWDVGPTKQSWDDLQPFWQLTFNLINSKKKKAEKKYLMKIFNIMNIKEMNTKPICFWCKYLHLNQNHQIINSKNELICPSIKNCINV